MISLKSLRKGTADGWDTQQEWKITCGVRGSRTDFQETAIKTGVQSRGKNIKIETDGERMWQTMTINYNTALQLERMTLSSYNDCMLPWLFAIVHTVVKLNVVIPLFCILLILSMHYGWSLSPPLPNNTETVMSLSIEERPSYNIPCQAAKKSGV